MRWSKYWCKNLQYSKNAVILHQYYITKFVENEKNQSILRLIVLTMDLDA